MGATDDIGHRTFDAIVIGSGISGGWAAKELTDNGLKTLLLERGRKVEHASGYTTTSMMPWEFEHRGELPYEVIKDNPIVGRCYAFGESTEHFFVPDKEHPYIQEKPFDWIRGYQVGGKSLLWARQTQRWSDLDFSGPARDGFAVDWPIRYRDLEPWYSHVEKFAGISGNKDGLAELPDGDFLPPMEMTCVEKHFRDKVAAQYSDRKIIIGRCANLTEARPVHQQQGRVSCQYRSLCNRGCPFGGYFSSNSSTIPWAMRTGKLTLQPDSVVHSIIYDEQKQRAVGVRVADQGTGKLTEYFARIIFLTAGAVNSNIILLNSVSARFPGGLGNDSGLLGKYFAFHNYRAKVTGRFDGFHDFTTEGRRPNGCYIPRFRNLHKQETDFLRGYAATVNTRKATIPATGWGNTLKEQLLNPRDNGWTASSGMMGETIPKIENTISLDAVQKDQWGVPLAKINVGYDDNDEKMIKDFFEQLSEMYHNAGFTDIKTSDTGQSPGLDIHEMGGVRMGRDPKSSLLNGWNQLHHCKNVFVTDGACMTSTSTQNPSLTYMALTARAVNYAVAQMKKNEL